MGIRDRVLVLLLVLSGLSVLSPAAASQPLPMALAPTPSSDPFYTYAGRVPLDQLPRGAVLKRREVDHHLAGLALPLTLTQLLYRTRDTLGAAATTVTTVIPPIATVFAEPRLVSFQFAYDALGVQCNPSYGYSGAGGPGGQVTTAEQAAVLGYLLAGYTVVVSDYEGQELHFGAGRESGMATLDGIRAAINAGVYGLTSRTSIAMVGYSGGSIATEWAAEQAPRYAPEIDRRLVGAAMGGTPTDLAHLLAYIDGSMIWAGAIPLGLVGLARAYDIDLDRYTNAYGKSVVAAVQDQCIGDVIGAYPGLTFADLMKPRFSTFTSIPPLLRVRRQVVMGRAGTPTTPLFFAVAKLDDTGDGIVVTQDVADLAADYCGRGVSVRYQQYTGLEHITGMVAFVPDALTWINAQFADTGGQDGCSGLG
ncbi:MAG: lipase [Actinobacteria bacterium]|uniref:Unannotated protein n=1 Tax=freshwater metagenome TaxID=449393 RepID=A0A6J6R7H3_9ZZZZ|nr:lipase [Actinomycetota bacterium]